MNKKCKNTECSHVIDEHRIYCSLRCRNVYVNKHLRDYKLNGQGLSLLEEYNLNSKKCVECKKKLTYKQKNNKFCSSVCSGKQSRKGKQHTEETKKKISAKISIDNIKKWSDPGYLEKNLISLKKRRFNSKGELEIKQHLQEKFPQHSWTSGGFFKVNENYTASVDVYSHNIKVCVEYDGIWHFKNIHGQLADKQKKDKMLNEWCFNNGYRIIRVKEEVYKKNKTLVLNLLEKEILFGTNKYTAFY